MSKDELIAKQQLKIEEYEERHAENVKTIHELRGRFISIGAPLNDNALQFTNEQLKWCQRIYNLIECIV